MKKKFILFISGILLLDQVTKFFFQHKNSVIIPKILFFKYSENPGLIYGLFANNFFFIYLLPILAIGFIMYYLIKSKKLQEHLPLVFILAGITGNLVGRIFYGYVIDFLYIPIYPPLNMANFNLADVAILTGVCWLFWINIKKT